VTHNEEKGAESRCGVHAKQKFHPSWKSLGRVKSLNLECPDLLAKYQEGEKDTLIQAS